MFSLLSVSVKPGRSRLCLVKTLSLMSLALLALSLAFAHPAHAQYPGGGGGYPGGYPGSSGWVPSDAQGNRLPAGSPNPSPLVPGTMQGDDKNTYPSANDPNPFWFAASSPSSHNPGGSGSYSAPGLSIFSHAANCILNTSYYGHAVGIYTAGSGDPSEWGYGAARPKDLLGDVTTDHQGLLTAYFAWAGPGLAPDHASFLVLTHLSASAGLSYGRSGQTGGLSATAKARTETFGEQVGASGDGETNPAPLNGRHLLRVSASGGVAKVELQGEVKTTTSNSLPFSWWSGGGPQLGGTSYYPALGDLNGPTDASASASLSATASYDGREVSISSPIETSFYKGNSQGGYSDRWQHQRDSVTGTIHVDSAATYSDADNAHAWIANTTLVANPTGFTNPTYSWDSDFNPVWMVGVDMSQQSVPVSWFLGNGSNFPITKNITVTVTDGSDGAKATNTYAITWHQPFEQWKSSQSTPIEEIDTIAPSSQPTGLPGGQVAYADQVFHCDFEFGPNQMADGIESAQKILPVTQPFFGPVWQSLIGAAGQPFDKALLGVTTSHDVVNNSDAFTEATYLTTIGRLPLVPPDPTGNIGTHERYKMVDGMLSVHYRKQFLTGDAYDTNGYAGNTTKTARTAFKVQATGRYVLITGVQH